MAKDLKSLVSQLANFGKAASIDQSVSDPAEKGQASTDVPKDRLIAPLAGQSASIETTPAISASEPAGEAKVEHGESTGKVTPAQDYVEPATVAGAKSAATLIEGAASLRSKLANFGKAEAAPVAPAPQATPAEVAPELKEASYVPGNHLLKVAAHLMSSAAGVELVNKALSEIQGEQEARSMVKAAADEYYANVRAYTEQRLAQADHEEAQMKYAHAIQQQVDLFAELTKEASEQEFADIDSSAALLKRASEIFEDNPIANACHMLGLQAAQKVAAAMDQGMPPEVAAQMAGEEGMGDEEGAPSPEEIMAALEALVSQGIISEEEAMQIIQELGGGGAPEGGEMPPQGGEMPKEASAAVAADHALEQVASLIFS